MLQNITTVDGIATEHFNTCLSFNNGSLVYMVDVYFSSSHWKMPSGQKAPVMLTLKVCCTGLITICCRYWRDYLPKYIWRPQWKKQKTPRLRGCTYINFRITTRQNLQTHGDHNCQEVSFVQVNHVSVSKERIAWTLCANINAFLK